MTAAIAILSGGLSIAGDWGNLAKNLTPLAPPPVQEHCLSYDYVDLEYIYTDYESTFFSEGHGYGVGFSKSIGSSLFFTGSFAEGSYDYNWVNHVLNVDTHRYRLGAGARVPLAECVELTFEGGAEHLEAEYGDYYSYKDYDSWGYYVGPGIRARSGRFEFFAKAFYIGREGDYSQRYLSQHVAHHGRVDDYGWVFTPGLIFHVTESFGLKLAAEFDENATAFTVGGRYHF